MEAMNIFLSYKRSEVFTDGNSSYDFLGGSICVDYKHGWRDTVIPAGKHFKPGYPPLSEWTADWLVTLVAAKTAGNSFSVVELGAGYGQWMVTAIRAFKSLRPDGTVRGLALEADDIHFNWLKEHVSRNLEEYVGVKTELVHAAAGKDGEVNFPVLDDPAKDYGASYTSGGSQRVVSAPSMSLATVLNRFDSPVIDLLHVDIQGAEEDLLLKNDVAEPLSRVKFIMVGTHRSEELHNSIANKLRFLGFKILLEWPRNSLLSTGAGEIKTTDGVVIAMNETVGADGIEGYFEKYVPGVAQHQVVAN